MDPELLKAARMYFDQIAKAKAAGDKPSASEKEAYARQLTDGSHGYADIEAIGDRLHEDGGNAVASFLQGATANFGDEIVGALPQALGGGEAGKEEMRLRGDFMQREHRVGDALAQGAGAVGTAFALPLGRVAEGASLAQKAWAGAKVGAALGAANGAGTGEDLVGRAEGAAIGGVGGGLVGAAVPALAGSRLGRAVTSRFSSAVGKTMSPLGASYAKLGGVRDQIEKSIETLGGYGAARDANAALAAGGRGDLARFADLGRPMTKLADFAATNSEAAHSAISDVVDARAEGATSRVLDDFKAAAGDQHAPTRQAQLAAETRAWANGPEGYGTRQNKLGLRGLAMNVPLGDAEPLVTQPRISNMFANAKATGQIGPEPEDLAAKAITAARATNPELDKFMAANPKLNVDALLTDPDVVAQMKTLGKGHLLDALKSAKDGGNSFDNVQDLHSALEDAASAAFRRGENNLGGRLSDSADIVRKTLEDTVPGYADIVDKYAARKGLERASELGQEWFHKKNDITGLNAVVDSMKDKPLLLEEFRKALASEQIVALQGKDGANAATKAMIGKNNLAQQRMNEIVFGDKATYDTFMQRAKAERQLGFLAKAVGGSQTAGRLAARDAALGVEGDVAHELQRGHVNPLRMAARKIGKATIGSLLEHRADALTPHLLTMGTQNIDDMLAALEATSARARVGAGSTRLAPGAITSLFGSLHPQD